MASVFLSYDRDDGSAARVIASALEKAGHSVWWDLHVRGGAQFAKVIEEALKAADAVVVLWSSNSVESAWVRDEAAAGRDSGRLVPTTIDGTEAPLGFRQFQTVDLQDWKRGTRSHGYKALEEAITGTSHRDAPNSENGTTSDIHYTAISNRTLPDTGRRRWFGLAAVASGLLLVGGLAAWSLNNRGSSVPVIGVAAADQSQTSQSIARDLLTKLGSLQAAKTNALELVGGGAGDPPHATFIFQASASGSGAGGNLVLFSGSDHSVLWSKDFNGSGNQTAVEQSMAYTAGQVIDCAVQADAAAQQRLDQETFKLFLNGCALFGDRYRSDPGSVVPIFSQVVARAPEFQPAWSKLLLAEAQYTRGKMLFYDQLAPGSLPEHIRAARALNPKLPELYIAEAALLPMSGLERRLALTEKAVRLNPDNPDLLVARSETYAFIGRNAEALDDAKRAAESDQLSPGLRSSLIQALIFDDQLPAAKEELSRAQQLWPGTSTIDDASFRFQSRYGDPRVALQMLQSPDFRQFYPTQEMPTYLQARIDPTDANIQRAIDASQSQQLSPNRRIDQTIQLLADFGRVEPIYQQLANLPSDRLRIVSGVFYRPNMRKFRQDPRFMPMVVRAGLVSFWRKSGKWPDFCFEPDLPYDCKKAAAKLGA